MKEFKHNFRVMGGPAEIHVYVADQTEAERVFAWAQSEAMRIEAKYSRFLPDSVVSRINAAAGGDFIELDDETCALVDYAAAAYEQSGGLFDITSGVLRRVWDFKAQKVPTQSELDGVLPLIGFDKVVWRRPRLKLPQSGMELDFGGLGKEFAVDVVATLLTEQRVQSGLVNFAGDVRVIGPQPDRKPWSIGIVHPREAGKTVSTILQSRGAIATSGDYERYFEQGGKRYCHIMNPRTGYPVNDLQSVSVLGESCLVAGTTTTTAMLLGEKKGTRYLQEMGVRYLLVTANGTVKGNID